MCKLCNNWKSTWNTVTIKEGCGNSFDTYKISLGSKDGHPELAIQSCDYYTWAGTRIKYCPFCGQKLI